jgi:hypothetical protein
MSKANGEQGDSVSLLFRVKAEAALSGSSVDGAAKAITRLNDAAAFGKTAGVSILFRIPGNSPKE